MHAGSKELDAWHHGLDGGRQGEIAPPLNFGLLENCSKIFLNLFVYKFSSKMPYLSEI